MQRKLHDVDITTAVYWKEALIKTGITAINLCFYIGNVKFLMNFYSFIEPRDRSRWNVFDRRRRNSTKKNFVLLLTTAN